MANIVRLDNERWTPVPRFIITKYCRRFHNAVLLVVLLRIQHFSWKNHCWPGVKKLSELTGWSCTRIRKALRTMGHRLIWDRQGTNLPWPLEIIRRGKGEHVRRHFRVRLVSYKRKGRASATFQVSNKFARYFGIRKRK